MSSSYRELHELSIHNPEAFWGKQAEALHWYKRWDKVLDDSRAPFFRWFKGGVTNLCYNAVDRHALGAGRNKAAIIWESPETNSSRVITFFELYRLVNRFAAVLKKNKAKALAQSSLTELWRHPLHTREFGSHATNVLRCLQLEAHGYQVSVTELVGWEHSMKNELIIASYKNLPRKRPAERLNELLNTLGLEEMGQRFFTSPQGI